ncbi:MAG: hypothetical protein N3D17_00120 [bacterium]|nr:hypothetical protein [bacterium]
MVKMLLRNYVVISMTLLLCGCGYKFISNAKAKIFIQPVLNYSLQPLVDIYLTEFLRDVFIKYAEYQPVKNSSDAEYTLKVLIKKWERTPLFFSGERSREIVIAKFIIEAEVILYKGENIVFTDTITDNISTSLGKEYEEEGVLKDISEKLANKIYFRIIDRK